MQIFVTSESAKESAERLWKNPTRARKMITETQQILACCQEHFLGKVTLQKVDGTAFKTPKSRMHHPCVKWACQSSDNVSWLIDHLWWLLYGYEGTGFQNVPDNIMHMCKDFDFWTDDPDPFLNFAKASDKGLDFTHIENVFEAYDLFLKAQNA